MCSCIIFGFYIKPQLQDFSCQILLGCIIFGFYIKPQQDAKPEEQKQVVSYLDSTSNHNKQESILVEVQLYHIWILHQTTTVGSCVGFGCGLYHIWILHQTTTAGYEGFTCACCIIFGFYIKPQHQRVDGILRMVVSYLDSTSNHNLLCR